MKEKLEELKKQKERLSDEDDAVSNEIYRIENQLREENANLYKRRWYCKTDSRRNEFDDEYIEYTLICITDVQVSVHSKPYFSGIRIDTDTNCMMKEFSFRRIEALTLEDIQEFSVLSGYESYALQNSLEKMLEELFILSPCLKEELKNTFE